MKTREMTYTAANKWVRSVWSEAVSRWSGREGQDKSYREHVVFPALEDILSRRFRSGGLRILDLGCGDGIFLDHPGHMNLLTGERAYLGIDVSGELLARAGRHHHADRIEFLRGDLTDNGLADRIIATGIDWNCVLSVFSVQEIPDIGTVLQTITRSVGSGAYVVIVTVHPDFAQWLLDAGKMRLEKSISCARGPGFRWAGYYPIVDEPHEPFYLPYFHRTIEDYEECMINHGILPSEIIELPGKNEMADLAKRGISPFRNFEHNVYWPNIVKQPSSIALIARKE